MFEIRTAEDFFKKFEKDFQLFEKDIADSGQAMNCILSAYHIHEWVWARWLKAKRPVYLENEEINDKRHFINWLAAQCPHFNLIQKLANGSKHCSPAPETSQAGAFDNTAFQRDAFDVSRLVVESETSDGQKHLDLHEIIDEVRTFWNDFFSEQYFCPSPDSLRAHKADR